MTYRGRVQKGVVVLEGSPSIEDGTVVDVVPVQSKNSPPPGSAEAIMRHAGIWEDVAGEVDGQLAELKKMKRAEVQAQLAKDKSGRSNSLDDQ